MTTPNAPKAATARLEYRLIASANPIRVSTPGGSGAAKHDSVFDLQVMITNPGPAVPLTSVTITFPLGPGDNELSTSLPSPTSDDENWSIESVDDKSNEIIIKHKTGSSRPVTSAIIFWLRGIKVNEAIGSVPITIDEFSPTHVSAKPVPPTLDKWPANFPVIDFQADPMVLYEPDQQATISWSVTEEGKAYDYRLFQVIGRSETQVDDSGITWDEDGNATVSVTAESTSQFELRVFDAGGTQITIVNPDGGHPPLQLTVWVEITTFYSAKLVKALGGRLVRLHWSFLNAADCTLLITDE